MIVGAVNTQRRRNAEFARDLEYIREMVADDCVEDRFNHVSNTLYADDNAQEYREAAKLLDGLTPDDAGKEYEIKKIMESTEDLSFDEMIGLVVE